MGERNELDQSPRPQEIGKEIYCWGGSIVSISLT